LREIVKQLENGQFYADLGGGVYKVQLAKSNEGKFSLNRRTNKSMVKSQNLDRNRTEGRR
jgi:hypothetical protein